MTTTLSPKRSRLYLKDSDVRIVRWLAAYRYLQPRHFQKLSGRHIVSIRRRLRQLLAGGLVERLTLPLTRVRPVQSPPDEYVYRLGRKGVALALEHGEEELTYTSEKKATFLEHDLAISTLHLALELAAQERGDLGLDWQQRQLQDWALDRAGERVSVNPDALFTLTDRRLPSAANTQAFFLEMVRSREHSYQHGESAFIRKCRAYHLYAQQGRHQRAWGIADFRVLIVTPTPQRTLNLCAKLAAAELPFKRFWLTDLTRYSLATPHSVLGSIWLTPRDFPEALYSLGPTRLNESGRNDL